MKMILMSLTLILIFGTAWAYSDREIVDAIYLAEGGAGAQYLYGIRSVKYAGAKEAEEICERTVRNQRERHLNHECGLGFLECLAKRYAPVGAGNDPHGLNQHWLKNVRYFLKRGEPK